MRLTLQGVVGLLISGERRQQLLIAGAGLAAGLIAQRLAGFPDIDIIIFEAASAPFGEHTWSFHQADITPADSELIGPLIAHRWAGQTVRFRDFERHLSSGYASLTSASMLAAMERLSNVSIRLNSPVATINAKGVVLETGESFTADCVIDARGMRKSSAIALGYQKFVGLEVETLSPHGVENPVVMDASVDQIDGYRFVYLLPFSPTRILIEDTRYADGGALDEQEIISQIHAYAARRGWVIKTVVRRESGVLPIALAHDAERFWSEAPRDVPQAGMRAALFHPTTGYSLPDAVRLANLVAESWPVDSAVLASKIRIHALQRHRRQRFYRLLNRMLFRAAQPDRRHLVLQRFYRLSQNLIERFYAGESTAADMARILTGKPPVPLHKAIACLREAPLLNPEKA
ncbi:lycopene beta-cyclase CrtY [Aureimonas fodinaquatilis]|uniref:Lycopene beta-cyclase CrtY n=1 Tax=Aureimonas fodinaquatilis TaxID=2565783 RepID=A0A5B0E0Y9_9HYPH|nr:lycopene beta-cyclase CrtY [Aureimonas fodinaquatilis]KAA0971962.1 lycopene beta-cyclase CrtY [Aureimonas fodinaquatilis]